MNRSLLNYSQEDIKNHIRTSDVPESNIFWGYWMWRMLRFSYALYRQRQVFHRTVKLFSAVPDPSAQIPPGSGIRAKAKGVS